MSFKWLRWTVGIVLVVIAVAVVIFLAIWGIAAIGGNGAIVPKDTFGMIQGILFPGGLPTPFFWLLLSVIIASAIIACAYENDKSLGLAIFAGVVIFILGLTLVITKGVTSGILASDYYLQNTTIKVTDEENLPAMLVKYDEQGSIEVDLEEGDLTTSWVPRVASATGALNVMSKTSGAVNNTTLMQDTITYLYGDGDSGSWTAIRNSQNQQDIYGIVSWDGTGDRVDTCRFKDDSALTMNFGGSSLPLVTDRKLYIFSASSCLRSRISTSNL